MTLSEAGDRGWGCAGTLPSYPKGIPDVHCGGRRVSSTVPSERCEAPEGRRLPSGGRANRRPSAIAEGKGQMKGKPSAPEPCRQQVVRRPRPEKYPVGGLAVLRALDNYQMFTGRFSDALLHRIPGQGRPPGLSEG
jgi:hypothetical protein